MSIRSAIFGLAAFAAAISVGNCSTINVRNVNAAANTLTVSQSRVTLSGSARIQSSDKIAKTSFDATAKKITVDFVTSADGKAKVTGMTSIKTATMDGPVKMVYVEIDAKGNTVKTTATADSAVYDGATQIAHLIGNVKIISENPEAFQEPAVMTGEKAEVNLKPNLSDDEMRFKVESENGVSTIDVTPKPQPKKESK